MSDLVVSTVQQAVAGCTHIGRVGGGLVPYPVPRSDGKFGLIINCEYSDKFKVEPAQQVLATARTDAALILKVLAQSKLEDTAIVCVRFGYYVGTQLRETVYACNLSHHHLKKAKWSNDFSFWQQALDAPDWVENSTISEIANLIHAKE